MPMISQNKTSNKALRHHTFFCIVQKISNYAFGDFNIPPLASGGGGDRSYENKGNVKKVEEAIKHELRRCDWRPGIKLMRIWKMQLDGI